MKLQLALDVEKKKAFDLVKKTRKYIDIIELGTPLIKTNGLVSVKEFRKFRKPIMADLKTMDTGFYEAELAFKTGADISTVCACSDIDTIKGAIKAAKKYKKKILVDTINFKNFRKMKKIISLSPDYVCVHTGIDMQNKGKTPFKDLKKVSSLIKNSKNKKTKICVAGGLNENNISKLKDYSIEIVIVGGAITKSSNPEKTAKKIKELL